LRANISNKTSSVAQRDDQEGSKGGPIFLGRSHEKVQFTTLDVRFIFGGMRFFLRPRWRVNIPYCNPSFPSFLPSPPSASGPPRKETGLKKKGGRMKNMLEEKEQERGEEEAA
jgi:hypothetical protein